MEKRASMSWLPTSSAAMRRAAKMAARAGCSAGGTRGTLASLRCVPNKPVILNAGTRGTHGTPNIINCTGAVDFFRHGRGWFGPPGWVGIFGNAPYTYRLLKIRVPGVPGVPARIFNHLVGTYWFLQCVPGVPPILSRRRIAAHTRAFQPLSKIRL
jgi:hypothetical protein